MTKRKNKRKGLRSINGRKKATTRRLAKPAEPRITLDEREELYVLRDDAKRSMRFQSIESGAPDEGKLVLVRLNDGTYRFGMVIKGRFANYEYHAEEFVTFAHRERITHFMEVIPPVPFSTAKAEAETPEAEFPSPPSIVDAALAAGAEDLAEDVYR